ncbi:MAG: hypothetical protein M1816_006551 [Peltula sp. TS41687]|nr:MAG: hypothetical protein M1816_006551 [Peltula sp. TS41687]
MSIFQVARQCAIRLGRGRPTGPSDAQVRISLENQLGRLKIWAGNLGVFAPGTASADYRLRNDEEIREIMVQMLTRLKKYIDQAMDPQMPELEEDDGSQDAASSSGSSSSSPSLRLDDDDSSPDGSATVDLLEAPSRNPLGEIDDIITRLYRLSAIIRRPNSSNESVRVAKYIEKGTHGQDLEDFESHVRWQVGFRNPETPQRLLDRLVSAVVARKKRLLYRERHQEKLNQGVDDYFASDLPVPTTSQLINGAVKGVSHLKTTSLRKAAILRRSSQTGPYSVTDASTVNPLRLASYPKSVALSGVTRSAVARREQLDIPPPPRLETSETTEIVCPYCFKVVDKEETKHPRWTRHVLKDIEPYVCLFDECDRSNECFKTVDDWMGHMQWQHTLIWSCQALGHESKTFNSKMEFERHMRLEHPRAFTESQLPMLVQKSAQPASDTFTALACQGDHTFSEMLRACPLCPFSLEGADLSSQSRPSEFLDVKGMDAKSKVIRDHLAAHLESIALLSLPERDHLDDADSNERQSQESRDTVDRKDQGLPSAYFDEGESSPLLSSFEPLPPAKPLREEDWAFVLNDPRVNRTPSPVQGQDPTLREFVRRARYLQMISSWHSSKIPIIIVHDPEGLELPGTQWSHDPEELKVSETQYRHVRKPPPQGDPVHEDPAPEIKIVVTDSDAVDVHDLDD